MNIKLVLLLFVSFTMLFTFNAQAQSLTNTVQNTTTNAQTKEDALLLYMQGRNLESKGKTDEAVQKYTRSVEICKQELIETPQRMDAYAVQCWSLFRLNRFKDVIETGSKGLAIKFDARIAESMGEAYFYLKDNTSTIKYMKRYIDNVNENADRIGTAYFFIAETYLRQKKYDHADIAYSLATYKEPTMAHWWYRYGQNAEKLGEYSKAHELYTKAVKLSPSMTDAVNAATRVKKYL